jgi:hypothetical protein
VTEFYIGYRVYTPNGEKFDERGRYNGWSNKYDEWISRRSPRLAPIYSYARKWKLPLVHSPEEAILDDSNDHIETHDYAYLMPRQYKVNNLYWLRNGNAFGSAGGFDWILARLQEPELSFPEFHALVDIFGCFYAHLHMTRAKQFVLPLKDAVMNYLLNTPAADIRLYDKDKIE